MPLVYRDTEQDPEDAPLVIAGLDEAPTIPLKVLNRDPSEARIEWALRYPNRPQPPATKPGKPQAKRPKDEHIFGVSLFTFHDPKISCSSPPLDCFEWLFQVSGTRRYVRVGHQGGWPPKRYVRELWIHKSGMSRVQGKAHWRPRCKSRYPVSLCPAGYHLDHRSPPLICQPRPLL